MKGWKQSAARRGSCSAFGIEEINNNFDIVDAIGKDDGKGMTATLFARGGDEYIRVSTSVPKPDGSGRAIGTVLAGPAI